MPETHRCPQCGAEVQAKAPEGLRSVGSRAAILVINVLLIIIFAACLLLFLSYSESHSESHSPIQKSRKLQIGYPTSPWFTAEKHFDSVKMQGGFSYGLVFSSWSWAIAAVGTLALWLVGKVNRVEKERHSRLYKLILNGIWPLVVLFAFTLAVIRVVVMMSSN